MDELRQSFESIREKLKDLFNRVNQLEAAPTVTSGSGGGAPVDAQYLTLAFNATLTQERRLDFSARFAKVDGGAGADYDVDLAASGVGAGVYGSATQVPQVTVDTYGRITNVANVAITGFVTGTGSAGRVAYWNGISSITGEDALWYDAGNNRLGVNDNTPSYTLDVNGIIGVNGVQTVYNAHALSASYAGTIYIGNGGGALSHLSGTDAYYNTSVGINALFHNTVGYTNTAVGYYALHNNIDGNDNVAIGYFSLISSLTTDGNVAVGSQALRDTTGSNNSSFGSYSMQPNTTGSYNSAIGYNAGSNTSVGAGCLDSNYSVFIGYDARPNGDSQSNQIVIGQKSRGNGSNTTTIGISSVTDFYAFGNHIIENAHFIGNGSATARLVFDSSGATNYAYFMASRVGIGMATPGTNLHIYNTVNPGIRVDASGATAADGNASILFYNDTSTVGGVNVGRSGLAGKGSNLNIESDTEIRFYCSNRNTFRGCVDTTGYWGINTISPSGQMTIDQSSDSAAVSVLELNQADNSEEMINFIVAGTGAGYPVDTATAVGATYARLRVAVNGTFKYIQLYNA